MAGRGEHRILCQVAVVARGGRAVPPCRLVTNLRELHLGHPSNDRLPVHDCPRSSRVGVRGSHSLAGEPQKQILYDGHMPTSLVQRTSVAAIAAISALSNPERGDMVAALGDTTGLVALKRMRRGMVLDPVGREILRRRPLINSETVDFARLRGLPPGTFGRAYMDYMDSHGYSADARDPVRFVDDEELAYVMLRYRQVHDLWHALSGLAPTVMGELALKWLEMAQTGLPIAALSAVFGPLSLSDQERRLLRQVHIPWALRCGRKARPLMNVWYEEFWDAPLDDFRKQLRFEAAPAAPSGVVCQSS